MLDWHYALAAGPTLGAVMGWALPAMLRRRQAASTKPADPEETFLVDDLPWLRVDDDHATVETDTGGYFRVYRIKGVVYTHLSDREAAQRAAQRKQWFIACRHNAVDMRFYSFRFRLPVPPPSAVPGFLGDLQHLWHQYLENVYGTDHFVVLSVKKKTDRYRLDLIGESLQQDLPDYGAEPVLHDPDADHSPLETFLGRLVGASILPLEAGGAGHLKEATAVHDVEWDRRGNGVTTDGIDTRYWAVIGIKEWGELSNTAMITALLNLPADLTVYFRVAPLSSQAASATTRYKQRQDNLGNDPNDPKAARRMNTFLSKEWKDTIDEIDAEKEALANCELAIFLRAPTPKALEDLKRTVRGVLGGKVNRLAFERRLAQRWYHGTWPGRDHWTRRRQFRTCNIADLTPFAAEPQGRHASDWGPSSLRDIPTHGSKTPYGLTLHVSDAEQAVAHFGAIAGTGSGKSVAMSWIITGALTAHPRLRAWMLDKDFGLRVLAAAIDDAQYLVPEADDLPLNFLDIDDTPAARSSIEAMFEVLADVDGDSDHEAIQQIADATRLIMKLDRPKRILRDLLDEGAFPPGRVKEALRIWTKTGRYGRIFNGTKDAFDPTGARLTVIDMTAVLEDKRLAGALTHYFLLRINNVVRDGKTPHIIFADETGTMVEDLAFARGLAKWLRTKRKDHGAVGTAWQEVAAVMDCSIAPVIRSNTKTWFIWPGTATSMDECKAFNLNDWESRFALGEANAAAGTARPILMKRENESVLLDFDLTPLGPSLKFFRGGAGPVEKMHKCIKQFGLDRWRHEYMLSV